MKILSIGAAYHDLNYCVLEDGKVVVHNELERFTRIKHDFDYDRLLNLLINNKEFSNVDHIVSSIHFGWSGQNGPGFVLDAPSKTFVGHHTSHAASAYYNSNFDDAIIFTFDGGGFEPESFWTTACVFKGKENKLDTVYKNFNFDIGGIWHQFLLTLGMDTGGAKPDGTTGGDESGTLMAMAAYGDYKKYLTLFENIFLYRNDTDFYDKNLSRIKEIVNESEENKFHLAASLQYVTEQFMKDFVFSHIDSIKSKNICFSGGVSLNCVSLGKIAKILKSKGYNVFCDQAPNDGGLSIGAAKYYYYHILDNPRQLELHHSYLGKTYSSNEIIDTITSYTNLNIIQDIELDKIVDLLMGSKIISVFNEGSESGKRALGNRSIIADPRFAYMKDFINEKVKHRKSFRPFAPSILREEVSNWFDYDIDSPYMSFAVEVKENKRPFVPAILHKDNTARLQTVTKKDNGYYYDLIKLFFEKTGVPMILNTSFNDREPIVETPKHAIDCFLRTKIDYLYFVKEKLLISKITQ